VPRGRDIKPGFFISDELAEVSIPARLLFIGLWTLADREGRVELRPRKLKAQLFPFDDAVTVESIEEMIGQLASARGRFLLVYEQEDQRFLSIRTFKKHQHIHPNEKASDIPAPPESDECGPADLEMKTYFIRCGEDGPIKIGKTNQIQIRMKNMQVGAPDKLVLLKLVEGNIEAECHEKFASLRKNGEWFAPSPELLAFIGQLPQSGLSRKITVSSGLSALPSSLLPFSGCVSESSLSVSVLPDQSKSHTRPSGLGLTTAFGQERAKVWPSCLPWVTARNRDGSAESFAASLPDDVQMSEVIATMRAFFAHVKAGHEGFDNEANTKDPSFAFGSWKSKFTALREEIHGVSPSVRKKGQGIYR